MRFQTPAILLAQCLTSACLLGQSSTCLIQSKQVGPVHLGMSVQQARKALTGATLTTVTDGDGENLFAVKQAGVLRMHLYAGEARNIERAEITLIRVFDPKCATADGVHPGMPLAEVEKRFSKLQRLERTELESREYAEFEKQPIWLDVEAGNGEAGVYPKGKRCASQYNTDAKVQSLWVSGPRRSNRYFENDTFCNDPAK